VRAGGGRRCWGLARLRAGRIHARGVLGAGPLLGKRLIFLLPPRAVDGRSRADETVDFSADCTASGSGRLRASSSGKETHASSQKLLPRIPGAATKPTRPKAKAAKPQGKRKTQRTTTPRLPPDSRGREADHLAISLPCPLATAAAECRRGRISARSAGQLLLAWSLEHARRLPWTRPPRSSSAAAAT
jgi:hypothetical protein